MRVRGVTTILAMGLTALAIQASAQAIPGPHAVSGVVQLNDGSWLGLQAAADAGVTGRAWVGTGVPAPQIEIALDCLEVSWHQPVYPIPPYLPFHAVFASGVGSDGVRYSMTAYDTVPRPVGFGDHAAVSTEPGAGPCGSNPSAAVPVRSGDVVVLP